MYIIHTFILNNSVVCCKMNKTAKTKTTGKKSSVLTGQGVTFSWTKAFTGQFQHEAAKNQIKMTGYHFVYIKKTKNKNKMQNENMKSI